MLNYSHCYSPKLDVAYRALTSSKKVQIAIVQGQSGLLGHASDPEEVPVLEALNLDRGASLTQLAFSAQFNGVGITAKIPFKRKGEDGNYRVDVKGLAPDIVTISAEGHDLPWMALLVDMLHYATS